LNEQEMEFWTELELFCKKNNIIWLEDLIKDGNILFIDEGD